MINESRCEATQRYPDWPILPELSMTQAKKVLPRNFRRYETATAPENLTSLFITKTDSSHWLRINP